MLLNAVTNKVLSIDSAWVSSPVTFPNILNNTSSSFHISEPIGIFILSILVLILFFHRFLIKTIGENLRFAIYPSISKGNNKGVFNFFFFFSLLFFIPIFSFLLNSFGFVIHDFLRTSLFILSFFICRAFILYIISYISSDKEMFVALNKLFISFFIVVTLLLLISSPSLYFINSENGLFTLRIVIASIIGLLFLFYIIELFKLFFSLQVPISFTFLYLCTVEFLPICIIIITFTKV